MSDSINSGSDAVVGIEEVVLVELAGKRNSSDSPKRVASTIELTVQPTDGSDSEALVRATVALRAAPETGEPAGEEVPFYEGQVAFFVRADRDATEEPVAAALGALVWPYVRSEIVGHSSRLGVVRMQLPLTF